MLDRGPLKDWFNSGEIRIEAAIAALAFYLFVVHTLTAKRPVHPPGAVQGPQFPDRQHLHLRGRHGAVRDAGAAAAAAAGPDGLFGGPAGLVTAPRGVGTLIAMMSSAGWSAASTCGSSSPPAWR